jgi:long-chain acyl-CoA synthetase
VKLDDLLFGADAPADGVAVFADDGETSWDALREQADELAAALRDAGVEAGDRVAVQLGNDARAIAAWFAVWRVGAVMVPLNPRLTHHEVVETCAAVSPVAKIAADGVEILGTSAPGSASGGDVALVSFTSGTTGRPKPVPLRHDRVLALMDGVLSTLRKPVTPDHSGAREQPPPRPPMPNLIPVSLSLWAGIYNVLFAFRVGAPVVLMERFDPRRFADLVAHHGIRSTVLPPAAMVMLADDPDVTGLAPLRLVRSISAPLSPLQARRFRDRFGVTVLNGYGQTELGGEVIGWSAADGREFGDSKLGAVGRPHAGIDARVVDDEGSQVATDEVGELEVRAAGRGVEGVDLADRMTPDGYLRTGDLARIDPDGFVWIEGRRSDMVNRGGMKVFPAAVEEVLRLDPSVADVAVVGEPDERLGEVPVAYVVGRPGTAVDPRALEAHCREHLAAYKVPVRFVAVTSIPRNEVGKVQRHLLT